MWLKSPAAGGQGKSLLLTRGLDGRGQVLGWFSPWRHWHYHT